MLIYCFFRRSDQKSCRRDGAVQAATPGLAIQSGESHAKGEKSILFLVWSIKYGNGPSN